MSGAPTKLDVVVVGAGFSGMYLVVKLRALGVDFTVLEQGSDIGGTWYWNRYPGARCDIPAIEYSYSFDEELEQNWDWQELMAGQPEILNYANQVAQRYDLRRDMQFNTKVTAAQYQEEAGLWQVSTESGERFEARYFIMATGCLSVPNWPDIPGREAYDGRVIHTGLWPHETIDFTGQHVGIIGTGSSAVQAIPEIAQSADQLYVFQRTPVYTFPAENHLLDDDFRADIKSRYADIRTMQRGSPAGMALYGVMGRLQELGEENIRDLSDPERRLRLDVEGLPSLRRYPDVMVDLEANEIACELYRDHIRRVIRKPETAQGLLPEGYPMGCKRQVIDIGYYEAFNRENVSLIDLRQYPIECVNATGLATSERQYDLDVLIYATGFDAMTGALTAVDIRGRDGLKLKNKWADGPRSYLGLQTAGFPNLFTVTGPGSPSVLSNMLCSIEQHCDWIAECIEHMRVHEQTVIEAEAEAEDAWVAHVNEVARGTMLTTPSCASWYLGANIPGKTRVFMPYVGGVGAYREKCDAVAAAGYEGFILS